MNTYPHRLSLADGRNEPKVAATPRRLIPLMPSNTKRQVLFCGTFRPESITIFIVTVIEPENLSDTTEVYPASYKLPL